MNTKEDLRKSILNEDNPPKMILTTLSGGLLILLIIIKIIDNIYSLNIFDKNEFFFGAVILIAFLRLSLLHDEKESKLYFSLRREELLKDEAKMYEKWLKIKIEENKVLQQAISS